MNPKDDSYINDLLNIISQKEKRCENLYNALEITANMYERATGLPMPSQAYRAIKTAGIDP